MAITFSTAYKNTPEDFQKRVYAQLQAQSIAIAAALALAAKDSPNSVASLNQLIEGIAAIDGERNIFPIDARDNEFTKKHLEDIFNEAKDMLNAQIDNSSAG